jgi:hypothetical protein
VDFLIINNRTTNLLLGIPYFIKTKLIFLYELERVIRAKLRSSNYKRIIIVTIISNPILVKSNKSEN